jgi:hypothetical protein
VANAKARFVDAAATARGNACRDTSDGSRAAAAGFSNVDAIETTNVSA